MPLELCCYLRSFSVTPQDRGGLFSYFLLSKKPLLLDFGNCTSSFPGYIGTKMLCQAWLQNYDTMPLKAFVYKLVDVMKAD